MEQFKPNIYYYLYAPYRLWFRIADIPRQIKWFIQRGRRGYSDCDLWNVGPFLIDIALATIQEFQKNFKENEYKSTPSTETTGSWEAKLQIMIDGLTAAQKICNHDFLHGNKSASDMKTQYNNAKVKADKAFDLLKDHIYGLWD